MKHNQKHIKHQRIPLQNFRFTLCLTCNFTSHFVSDQLYLHLWLKIAIFFVFVNREKGRHNGGEERDGGEELKTLEIHTDKTIEKLL